MPRPRCSLSLLALSEVLIAHARCPITSRKLCLWLSVNFTAQVLAARALGQAPASYWLGSSEAEQRWMTANEEVVWGGGLSCCWIVWHTTDKLTTSAFIHHNTLDVLKCSCGELTARVSVLSPFGLRQKMSSWSVDWTNHEQCRK